MSETYVTRAQIEWLAEKWRTQGVEGFGCGASDRDTEMFAAELEGLLKHAVAAPIATVIPLAPYAPTRYTCTCGASSRWSCRCG